MIGVSPGDGQLLQRSIFLTHTQGLGSAASILLTQEGLEGRSHHEVGKCSSNSPLLYYGSVCVCVCVCVLVALLYLTL